MRPEIVGRQCKSFERDKNGKVERRTHVFNQSALVLEGVTLAQVVKFVVQVLIDLARGTVLNEKSAQNSLAAHPKDLAVIE
jgi:hypothetical protein